MDVSKEKPGTNAHKIEVTLEPVLDLELILSQVAAIKQALTAFEEELKKGEAEPEERVEAQPTAGER